MYMKFLITICCALSLMSAHSKQREDTIIYKTLPYSGEFSSDKDRMSFQLLGYMLSTNYLPSTDGVIQTPFHICKEGRELGTVDLGCMRNEGLGYRAYMFGGAADKYQAIIIEALAGNGTAWYWIVLSDGKRIVSQRLMDEPRANSDICDLKDVMQISVSDVDCKIRMELKNIADYSTIPKYLKTDSRWVYITMPIGNNLEGVEALALGMKYEKRSDWNDFSLPHQTDYTITSRPLGRMLNVQDSVFVDNGGATLSEDDPVVSCRYISGESSAYPNWLILSKVDSLHTLTSVIRVDKGKVHSAHCRLKDSMYVSGICVGNYPVMKKDSILFEIQEIYGITRDGAACKLSLDTEIESCSEPFEPEFPTGKFPAYYYYVDGGKKYYQEWQEQ